MAARLEAHRAVSDTLAHCSDTELAELVPAAPTGSIEIAGKPVFVKRVALCDLERRAENLRSTANLFTLPAFYQYGVGSSGFGAWREVAAHEIANAWAVAGECTSFPLLHHWRVLDSAPPTPFTPDVIDRLVAYWAGAAAVRVRLEAIASARASVVLFLEHVPHTLHDWLGAQIALGDATVTAAIAMVEPAIESTVAFLRANDLCHFDAHFRNILTDGEQLFFADLGLASSRRFALSDAEHRFLDLHAGYDRAFAMTELAAHLAAAGHAADDTRARHARTAEIMTAFLRSLRDGEKSTPFPADELDAVAI